MQAVESNILLTLGDEQMKFVIILLITKVTRVNKVIDLVPRRGINVLRCCSSEAGGMLRPFSLAKIKKGFGEGSKIA